jgi:hypothetical protein
VAPTWETGIALFQVQTRTKTQGRSGRTASTTHNEVEEEEGDEVEGLGMEVTLRKKLSFKEELVATILSIIPSRDLDDVSLRIRKSMSRTQTEALLMSVLASAES